EELNTALKSLQEKLQHTEKMKEESEKTVQHIKSQAEHTEHQIKQQFEKLHQFLRDEEEATITALREEEEQKKQMMKEKLEEINRHISALSHTIKDTEEMMKDNDNVCFLKELNTALKSLQEKLEHNEKMKKEFETTVQHIKSQAEHTEHQIKQQFEKFHQFLRDEEEATIAALREEEEQKKQMMKEKLEEINRHISALSQTIKDTEEMMKDNDVCFLKKFPVSMERVQISQPDPQMPSGALIDVPRYLGNLPFRVWKKMQDIVQNTPVILDPNTANPHLILSDDLTSVRYDVYNQLLPDNPERFEYYPCVLGSEGFNSGTHCWDVEVKESQRWTLGVTTASNQRKGCDFFNTDVWNVVDDVDDDHGDSRFTVKQKLDRVRVYLDYDRGTVSFSDPVTNTHLHTFTTTFTDTVFPFFYCSSSLRILPINS
ncbi:hypothetical protein QQF64_025651, partial [Cirrhinus molitorella]